MVDSRMVMKKKRVKVNKGWWQTQRDRCRIADVIPPSGAMTSVSIGDVVKSLIGGLKLQERDWMSVMTEEWQTLAGDAVARHSRPGRVDGTRLIIFVDNAVWLSELSRYGKGPLLTRIQAKFGKDRIKVLTFMPDPEGGRSR